MAQQHNQQQAAQKTPLAQRVLEELLAARKRSDGLSPTGIAACPTMTSLLGVLPREVVNGAEVV